MKPLIRRSDLTDPPRYYLLTRYRVDGNSIVASQKYDVTDQIEALFSTRPDVTSGDGDGVPWPRLPDGQPWPDKEEAE